MRRLAAVVVSATLLVPFPAIAFQNEAQSWLGLLDSLWAALIQSEGTTEKHGMCVDPDGRSIPCSPENNTSDEYGAGLDPAGTSGD